MFDNVSESVTGMVSRLLGQIPDMVYQQATQAGLMDGAIKAVVQEAARSLAGHLMPAASGGGDSPLGGALGSMFSAVSGALGAAQQAGLGALLQQALDHTDLDERIRDAVLDGLTRYLRDNAGALAQAALAGLRSAR